MQKKVTPLAVHFLKEKPTSTTPSTFDIQESCLNPRQLHVENIGIW